MANTLENIYNNTISELIRGGISKNEAFIEAQILIEHVFGFKKTEILAYPEKILNDDMAEKLKLLIKERIDHKIPVQYLTNKGYFMGYEFYVDKRVLIPRPETELLVEEVIKIAKSTNELINIIDIGTGSGCIACMLAKILNIKVIASDTSQDALEIAQINAKRLKVEDKIVFKHSDIFDNIEENFDIIVSNPPYIPIKEKENLQTEVSGHEPHLALFADDENGISFYEKLIFQSAKRLNPHGYLAVETGINQSTPIKSILETYNFEGIKIIKDYNNIERIITARKSS